MQTRASIFAQHMPALHQECRRHCIGVKSAAVAASSPLSRVTSDRPAIRQQSRPDGDNG
ncbi:hypothetical protein PPTG_20984 [Phytophthora nicotianae INRA-310]|uniref:Uncharacterized protein n=2 Tax=Phytophthora nicotianae TaxID=4792 RepID=W2RFG9_PHYN3|nr:hypothetical protein PPTG_20984 [Phytophthora nicotianae INRA-310]ETN23265.1 hypothetical protein PPTG_20984 [Phytophthora nicotianae INRA-310]ETO78034.1 hypothetical protein F444_06872 [Phytophthora nicotianae P1976]